MIELANAAAGAAPKQPSGFVAFLPWIAIFAVMYFIMIRPQQKREKERQAMISELKKGDRVLLMSGMYGRVVKIVETVVSVERAKGFTVDVERNAIAAKVDNAAENTASE